MSEDPKSEDTLTEAEKMRRTAEVVKRMLETPPQPKAQPKKTTAKQK